MNLADIKTVKEINKNIVCINRTVSVPKSNGNSEYELVKLWEKIEGNSIETMDIHTPTYQELRKVEYDKLNQFELQYNDLKNGTNTWHEAIEVIKQNIPKTT